MKMSRLKQKQKGTTKKLLHFEEIIYVMTAADINLLYNDRETKMKMII